MSARAPRPISPQGPFRAEAAAIGAIVLKSDPQVEWDWQVGQEVVLRDLLQRHGYESLEAVRTEAEIEALKSSILDAARHLAVSEETRAVIAACQDIAVLKSWLVEAATASGLSL